MRYALLCFAIAWVCGCGGTKSTVDNSQDPDAYARDVKQLVFTQVSEAAKSREPADQMATVIAELEQVDRPQGSHKATYASILSTAKEIEADCKKANGRPANLTAQLAKLKKLSDALPGTIDTKVSGASTKQPKDD